MNECKRILCNPLFIMVLVVIVFVNMGFYLHAQFPQFEIGEKMEEISIYQNILEQTDITQAGIYEKTTEKWEETLAYAILQDESNFFYTMFKDLYPDTWRLIQQGNGLDKAQAYTLGYERLLAQITYLNDFSDRNSRMEQEYRQKSKSPVFKQQGVAMANMEKTVKDFKKTEGVATTVGDDRALTSVINADYTDFLLLFLIAIICMQFISERQSTMWDIVHATPGGRVKLAGKRILCLFAFSCIGVLLLVGAKLVVSFYVYQGNSQWNRYIQSMEAFSKFLLPIQVKHFIPLYLAWKTVCIFFVGLTLWMLISFCTSINAAILGGGAFLAVEYALSVIATNSSLINLKHINVFSYIHPDSFFTTYQNLSIGRELYNAPDVLAVLLFFGIIGFTIVLLVISSRKKPERKEGWLQKLFTKMSIAVDKVVCRAPGIWQEAYKKLILEKGWMVLAVALILLFTYQAPKSKKETVDMVKQQYYQYFFGLEEEALFKNISFEKSKIDLEKKKLMEEMALDPNKALYASTVLEQNFIKSTAIEEIEEEAKAMVVFNRENKVPIKISDYYHMESIIGEGGKSYRQARSIILLLMLVLLFASFVAFEKQEKVIPVIRATKTEPLRFWKRKGIVYFLCAIFILICLYLPEIKTLGSEKYVYFQAAIQSIPSFNKFAFNISIKSYLLILYAYRVFVMVGIGVIIMYLSSFSTNVFSSTLVLLFIVGLPAVALNLTENLFFQYLPAFLFSTNLMLSLKQMIICGLYGVSFFIFALLLIRRIKEPVV